MTFLPLVIDAEYVGGFQIHLRFNDGSAKTVDFQHWLRGPIFEPLKDPESFRQFFLEAGTVSWAERGRHCSRNALPGAGS